MFCFYPFLLFSPASKGFCFLVFPKPVALGFSRWRWLCWRRPSGVWCSWTRWPVPWANGTEKRNEAMAFRPKKTEGFPPTNNTWHVFFWRGLTFLNMFGVVEVGRCNTFPSFLRFCSDWSHFMQISLRSTHAVVQRDAWDTRQCCDDGLQAQCLGGLKGWQIAQRVNVGYESWYVGRCFSMVQQYER